MFLRRVGMSNVLSESKQQQILALGRLTWSFRRIEQATAVRRETASAYWSWRACRWRIPNCAVKHPETARVAVSHPNPNARQMSMANSEFVL